MRTRTGSFPIGFRRGGGQWQKDAAGLAAWAKGAGFEAIDLTAVRAEDVAAVREAGMSVVSLDLPGFGNLVTADDGVRREAIDAAVAGVEAAATLDVRVLFTVIIPSDRAAAPADNYRLAVETYGPIADAARRVGSVVVIEGWPGGPPHYANLCCTPETCRAFLKDVGEGVGLNYDPSHLVRLGVNPLRFLHEFLPHVRHVHAKDTEVIPEAAYEFGLYQPAAFAEPHGYGEHAWRYTLPGHGLIRWPAILEILAAGGYGGVVSVELEDKRFNGTEAGEKEGLTRSLEFLSGT